VSSIHDRAADISAALGEDKDCGVLALARVLDISYETAHMALMDAGREHSKGTPRHVTRAALRSLGFKVLRTWSPTDLALATGRPAARQIITADPMRFPGTWNHMPPMLIFIKEHVAAFRAGTLHDWTNDANAPVQEAWEIARISDQVQLGQRPPGVIHLKDHSRG
jgi:hypothetical protein